MNAPDRHLTQKQRFEANKLREAPVPPGRAGDRRFRHDRSRRPRHGVPLGRQGQLRPARRAAQAARARADALRAWSRSISTRSIRAIRRTSCPITLSRWASTSASRSRTPIRSVKRLIPEGKTMCSLCSRLRRGVLYRVAGELGRDQDRAGPSSRRHPGDVFSQPVLRRQAEGHAAEAGIGRRQARGDPPARLREGKRPRAYAEVRAFPIIPCDLCGSQDNLQRKQVKQMLREWEKKFPGRVETIFNSLQNVVPVAPAGPRAVRFPGREPTGRADAGDGDKAFDEEELCAPPVEAQVISFEFADFAGLFSTRRRSCGPQDRAARFLLAAGSC